MFCYTAVMLLPLIAASAPVKSSLQSSGSTTGDTSLPASGFEPNKRTADIHSNVRDHVRFFIPPEDSTLPPTVTSAAWKHSSSVEDDYNKGGSADGKYRASRWTNEIVRRESFTGNDHDEKTESPASETSTAKLTGSKPDKEIFEVDRSSVGEDVTKSTEKPTPRDRDERKNSTTQHQPSYDAAAAATDDEKSDFDATDVISDEAETSYDDDADYDVADEEYEDDDDEQYYDDESNQVGEQEVEEYDETRVEEQRSVGREGAHFQEYEISADSSRGLDYDTTNAEVVSELQVVDRPVRRRRRKGRLRTTNKTRRSKRRRKRPPVEPVGRVKKPTRTQRQPTRAGASRRKTKARRRRKGQSGNKRRTRKNRRNKQTTSLSFDFGAANGNGNKFEQRYRRPNVGESTKPRLQQSGIVESLQERYQQQQQQDGYTGQLSVPRYSDIYAGDDRRRTVAASTDVRGQSSQEAATNRGVHASVSGRVPPVTHHVVQQTRQRAQSTPLQGHTFDLRRYYQLPQYQRPNYYHEHQHQQQQQHPGHPRQYYQSYYQQQSPPTFSRHQQQIHFIVPTSDFDVRRIPQVMSALGLNDYISGPRSTADDDDDDTHLQFLGYQHPSPNSGAYREGHPAKPAAEKDVDDDQLASSPSGSGLMPTGDAVRRSQRLRYQRSTSVRRRAVNEDDAEASDERSELQATRRDRSEHVADDVDDDDEYIDNSDIEITTRSYGQTTAVRPF